MFLLRGAESLERHTDLVRDELMKTQYMKCWWWLIQPIQAHEGK